VSHLGVFGMTESGKSFHLKRKLLPTWSCVIACDFNDELSIHGREKAGRELGPLRERMTASQLRQHPSKVLEADLQLSVVPDQIGNVASEAACFDLVARLLIRASRRFERPHNIKLVVDECAQALKLIERMNERKHGETSPAERLVMLATRGVQHLDVDLVMLTQRPNLLHVNVRGNLDQVVYFKLPEAVDIDTVRAKAGKEFAARVRQLPLQKHIVWRATGSTESAAPPEPQEQVAHVEGS
jgi:hypothetical protein